MTLDVSENLIMFSIHFISYIVSIVYKSKFKFRAFSLSFNVSFHTCQITNLPSRWKNFSNTVYVFYVRYLWENLITCFIASIFLHKNTMKSENDVIAGREFEIHLCILH
jgi:hypothetical protein